MTIAVTAIFLSEHYGGPAMLFALLLGIAFNFLGNEPSWRQGIGFSSQTILRLGVGLLGIRITFGDIASLGFSVVGTIAGLVTLTIGCGFLMARFTRRPWRFALISGGAVAICGASAALAIAAILPASRDTERNTLFTVMAVTTLSTIAMVLYPALFSSLGLDGREIGFLIGATIHDVAQVVGAGYSVSQEAGDTATIVKLFRVALLPVVLFTILIALNFFPRQEADEAGQNGHERKRGKLLLIPWFMVMFLVLAFVNSLVDLPAGIRDAAATLSYWMLVIAIAALGVKTSIRAMLDLGRGHVTTMVAETLILLAGALVALTFLLDL